MKTHKKAFIHEGIYVATHESICVCMYTHKFACIYTSVHTCLPNFYSNVKVYTYLIPLNKYGCQISNMNHTAIMLNGHKDPTYLYMCLKTKAAALPTSHVIAMHVPASKMSLKYHIYATYDNYFICTQHIYVSKYLI